MKVSIIGAGLIGKRRAQTALEHGDTISCIFDPDNTRAGELAELVNAHVARTEEEAINCADIVVVATPNKFLLPNARAALKAGKHVLIEKPMGRNLAEAIELSRIQTDHPDLVLKTGFNHRYHPAIAKAYQLVKTNVIGDIMFLRAMYGHGGRPGYENEWRGNKDMAGGGELTDQGVHLLDLICWFNTMPEWTFAQRRMFAWPLNDLEDNGFFMLGWNNNSIAQIHTSWTQWKNRFELQIYGQNGSIEINGLGGSYGEETLTICKRKPEGGRPDIETQAFPEKDNSWLAEWQDFRDAINTGKAPMGNVADGINVMKTLNAIYKSCDSAEKILIG